MTLLGVADYHLGNTSSHTFTKINQHFSRLVWDGKPSRGLTDYGCQPKGTNGVRLINPCPAAPVMEDVELVIVNTGGSLLPPKFWVGIRTRYFLSLFHIVNQNVVL